MAGFNNAGTDAQVKVVLVNKAYQTPPQSYSQDPRDYWVRGNAAHDFALVYAGLPGPGAVPILVAHEIGHLLNAPAMFSTGEFHDHTGHAAEKFPWPHPAFQSYRTQRPYESVPFPAESRRVWPESEDHLMRAGWDFLRHEMAEPGEWLNHFDWSEVNGQAHLR